SPGRGQADPRRRRTGKSDRAGSPVLRRDARDLGQGRRARALPVAGVAMTPIPVYGFVAGGGVGGLVLVYGHDTVAGGARRVQQAAAVRVAPRQRASVHAQGKLLDRDATVKEVGLVALDRIDVGPEAR